MENQSTISGILSKLFPTIPSGYSSAYSTPNAPKAPAPTVPPASSPVLGVKAVNPSVKAAPKTTTIKPKYQAPIKTPPPAPVAPPDSFVGQGAPNTIINPQTGQTAGQAFAGQPATQFTSQPGGTTPSGATVDANGVLTGVPGGVTNGQPNATASGIINSLIANSQGQGPVNPAAAEAAKKIADIQRNIGQLRQAAGTAEGAYTTGGLTLPVAQGRAQAIAQTEAQQEAGLGIQQQAAQSELQNTLASQQQGTSGLISALTGSLQTTSAPYGIPLYNPATGKFIDSSGGVAGGSNLNPLNNLQGIVQGVLNHQISPQQALSMGGTVSNWQSLLTAALQQANPGFNFGQAQAAYDAAQQNAVTAGTAVTNANAAAYAANLPAYLNLKNTVQNVDQFGTLLLNSMVAPDGTQINPTDARFANSTLSNIKNQLSQAQQAVFDSTYASLKSRISGLLASGGAEIPTQITSDANKILDGSLPLKSLSAVLERIKTEGQILLNNQATLVNEPLQTAGGSSRGTVGNTSSSSSSNPLGL